MPKRITEQDLVITLKIAKNFCKEHMSTKTNRITLLRKLSSVDPYKKVREENRIRYKMIYDDITTFRTIVNNKNNKYASKRMVIMLDRCKAAGYDV